MGGDAEARAVVCEKVDGDAGRPAVPDEGADGLLGDRGDVEPVLKARRQRVQKPQRLVPDLELLPRVLRSLLRPLPLRIQLLDLLIQLPGHPQVVLAVETRIPDDGWLRSLEMGPLGLAENLSDDRDEVLGRHRLHDEAVRTEAEREVPILVRRVGGGVEDQRDRGESRFGLHRAAELIAIHDRHQDVRDHEIGAGTLQLRQGFLPVARRRHLMAVAPEKRLEEVAVFGHVVGDYDPHDCSRRNPAIWAMIISGSMGFSM